MKINVIATLLCLTTLSSLFGIPQPVVAGLPQASNNRQQFNRAPAQYGATITGNILRCVTFLSLPMLAAGQSNATTMSLDTYMNYFYITTGVGFGICLVSSCVGCFMKNAKHCKKPESNEAEDTEASLEQIA
jgi:hypothetical protein